MADWKKRAETEGRTFPNGFRDVQADPDCNAEWQVMAYFTSIILTHKFYVGIKFILNNLFCDGQFMIGQC